MTKTTNGKILLGCVYANPKNKDMSTRGGMECKWHCPYVDDI